MVFNYCSLITEKRLATLLAPQLLSYYIRVAHSKYPAVVFGIFFHIKAKSPCSKFLKWPWLFLPHCLDTTCSAEVGSDLVSSYDSLLPVLFFPTFIFESKSDGSLWTVCLSAKKLSIKSDQTTPSQTWWTRSAGFWEWGSINNSIGWFIANFDSCLFCYAYLRWLKLTNLQGLGF